MTTRAVLYARVSTMMQERDGVSLDAQLAMARQFCEVRGITFAGQYVDTMSGQSDERPGLARLEADLERGAWDAVLVYKLDRLSRNAAHYHALLQRFEEKGATLASLTQPFDGTTAHGRFMLSVLIAASQLEVEVTSDRIRDSLRYRAEQGRIMSNGRAPLGYTYHHAHKDEAGVHRPGHFTVNEAEAPIVRWIFERYIALRSITGVLNEAATLGIRARNGAPLTKTVVAGMLRRPLYIGTYEALRRQVMRRGGRKVIQVRPRDERVRSDGFPALIDRELWEQAQAILTENDTIPRRLLSSRRLHVWSGLLRCANCGGAMARQIQGAGRKASSYNCRRRGHYGIEGCSAPATVPESFLFEMAAPALFAAITDAVMRGRGARRTKPKAPDLDTLTVGLRDIERRRENVQDMREEGRLDREKYKKRMDKLDAEEAALRQRFVTVTPAAAPPPEILKGLNDAWARFADHPAERREVLTSVLREVRVDGKARGYTVHLHLWPLDLPGWPETLSLPIVTERERRARGGN